MRSNTLIVISFLVALILTIAPLSHAMEWWRPQWVVLVLIYWVLVPPHRVGIFTAWLVGLSLDMLTGLILGQSALGLVIIAYICAKFSHRIVIFTTWQKALFVLMLVLLYQLYIFWLSGLMGRAPVHYSYWLSSVSSLLCWPLVLLTLKKAKRYYS